MTKTIVLVGSFDTKAEEFSFVKRLIQAQGCSTLTVDFGIMGEPGLRADVARADVVASGGGDLSRLASGDHKDEAMKVVSRGLARIVRDLFDAGKLDGILGMGGSGGTSVATAAMRTLPVGIPKVMVSTVAGSDVSAYVGVKDVSFIPSVVDVAGINCISRDIYANAAGAICGMVKARVTEAASDKPLIAASMFGNTTAAVNHARGILTAAGYEVLVFHCTGVGGRTMESLIADGRISGVLDITTTELADNVCRGVYDAGAERCLAAARAGVPTVLVPGCVDMANFGSPSSLPSDYQGRLLYEWNDNVTLLRTNVEENTRIGSMIAAAANLAPATTAILLPLGGVSMLDSPGGSFWDPEADAACFESIKANLNPAVPVIEMNLNINDPQFSGRAAEVLSRMLRA